MSWRYAQRMRAMRAEPVEPPAFAWSCGDEGELCLEVNGTPGLHYHYQVSKQPTENPVAIPILERLLTTGVR